MQTDAIEIRTLTEQPTAAMVATLTVPEMQTWFGPAFATVAGYLARCGAGPAGMPYARYRRQGEATFEVEAGFPSAIAVEGEGEVRPSSLPGGEVAATWHVGPYDTIAAAYDALDAYVTDHGWTATGPPWEVYHSDPTAEPDPAQWRTEIFQPFCRG